MLWEAIAIALLGCGIWNWGYWRGRAAKAIVKEVRVPFPVYDHVEIPTATMAHAVAHYWDCQCPKCRPDLYPDGKYAVPGHEIIVIRRRTLYIDHIVLDEDMGLKSHDMVEYRPGGMSQPRLLPAWPRCDGSCGPNCPHVFRWKCLMCGNVETEHQEWCRECGHTRGEKI